MELGLSPGEFWDQTYSTYMAAMLGAQRARKAAAEQARDLALLTAYYGGALSQTDWKAARIPHGFNEWRDKLLGKTRRISAAERFEAFAALADSGFDITITTH